jgi:hypothetical protein
MALARALVLVLELYLACGLVFALAFVTAGAGVVDPVARTGTRGFRVLLVPGSAALWPWLLVRWLGARRAARAGASAPGESA